MSKRSIRKSTEAYNELCDRLKARGHTIRSFALEHGYKVPTAYDAAHGKRKGKKSIPILQHLRQFVYES